MKKRLFALLLTLALMVPGMSAFAAEPEAEDVVVKTEAKVYQAGATGFIADAQGRILLYVDGVWMNNYTGFYYDINCGWWLIQNGIVDTGYNDLFGDPVVGWWKVKGGTIDFAYTGWYTSPTVGTWYVQGGMLDFSKGSKAPEVTTTVQGPQAKGATAEEAQFASRVLELVNAERAKAGVQPLSFNQALLDCAQLRATECVTQYGHTRPDGSSCFTAFSEFGIARGAWAENVAAGQRTPESVVNAWMNSEGHRKNIMNPTYNYIGVGCKQSGSGYGIYWAQCFSSN